MHNTIILCIFLIVVIVFLVMLAQRIRVSYPIVLVIGGLVLSFIPGLPAVTVNPELIFLIFLPPLLYDAAWQTSWKDFWRWRRVIGSFAFGIVILTSCVIAYVSQMLIPGYTLALGFLLGGIISPPDAVAATSILKDIKVTKRLITIVEGESLLNDASSLIVFRCDCSRYRRAVPFSRNHIRFSHLSRMYTITVWSTVGFVFNGIVFMLIGLQLPVIVKQLGDTSLYDAIQYGVIISGVVIVTRMVCTIGASYFTVMISRFITTADSRPGLRAPIIFGWTGMRGVVSLASALSIPWLTDFGLPFPQRNLILFITFVVILVTLVFQGLTLPMVVKWMNVSEMDYSMFSHRQDVMIRRKLAEESLLMISTKFADQIPENGLLQSLQDKLKGDIKFLEHIQQPEEISSGYADIAVYRSIAKEILENKRALLHKFNKKAVFEEEVIRQHLAQLDLEEEKIRQQFLHMD